MEKITGKELNEAADNPTVKAVNKSGSTDHDNDGFELIAIEDEDGFNQWAEPVWNMLTTSHENVGGLKGYRSYYDFCQKKHLFIIALGKNNKLMACATYRRIVTSKKMVVIGCEQSKEGKLALQCIVHDNIKNFGLHYWAEVSGRIERYFRKHYGYPMPNTLAGKTLNVDESEIKLSEKDNVHYYRLIDDGDFYEKMIFCAENEEPFNKVMEEVEAYGTFMQFNDANEAPAQKYTIKQAVYIIENIYRAHEEDGFNELIPSWHQGLLDCLETLCSAPTKTQSIIDYIRYGEYLLEDMQLLELHPLEPTLYGNGQAKKGETK